LKGAFTGTQASGAERPIAEHVEREAGHDQCAAGKLDHAERLAEQKRGGDHADNRHQKRERGDGRRRMMRHQAHPQAIAVQSPAIGKRQHADDKLQARMGERGQAPRALDGERQRDERQRRGQARPDGEGEHVDLADALRQHVAGAPERRRQNDEQERPEARPCQPFRSDDRHAERADSGAHDLHAARRFGEEGPGEQDGEEHLRHDDQRRQPNREPLVDGDEKQAELPTPIRSP
jgi:hypothetical protein